MKVRSESVSQTKTKGNGSAKQSRGADQSDSVSGNGDCPREQMIAEAAYFLAEQRGFASGYEMADWLRAENQCGRLSCE